MSEKTTQSNSIDSNSVNGVELVVRSMARTAIENEDHFCQLDSVVGDGDFGFSLARGFEKVLEEIDSLDRSNAAVFLQRVGMLITSRCGGTSGPLWGTAFLRAGKSVAGLKSLSPKNVTTLLRAAFVGIQQRGKAQLGDKTLLDALGPFIDKFEAEIEARPSAQLLTILGSAVDAAVQGARATEDLVAKRGRAAYSGERSRGSVDPGAAAVALIVANVLKDCQLAQDQLAQN